MTATANLPKILDREELAAKMSCLMKTDPRVACYSDVYDLVAPHVSHLAQITGLTTGKIFADLVDDVTAMGEEEEGSIEGNYGDPDVPVPEGWDRIEGDLPTMEEVLRGEKQMSPDPPCRHGWR